jgi:hypothetical protein
MSAKARAERIARLADVANSCLTAADRGLETCAKALEDLQPFASGRISVVKTTEKSRSKSPINEVRWRVVRWRIRHENSDGSVEWETHKLPLRGASRMALGRLQFHDTQSEEREVIRTAVELIEWRARVVRAVTNFVTALEAHQRTGLSDVNRRVEKVLLAVARGQKNRADIKAKVERIVAEREKSRG